MQNNSLFFRWPGWALEKNAPHTFSVRWNAISLLVLVVLFSSQHATAVTTVCSDLRIAQPGEHWLNVLSPNLLELVLVNTKTPDPGRVDSWDWVNSQGAFSPPDLSSLKVLVNGQPMGISAIGFKRRPLYAPLLAWDLRIGNQLYLQLTGQIPDGSPVQVLNNGTLWSTNMSFAAMADLLRCNPAIHVNHEGYLPTYPKKAIVGYFLGELGELPILTNRFYLVNSQSGTTVYQGELTLRRDVGYTYTPAPYQNVYEADFSSFTTPGEYRLAVPGMGASMPFRIDEGLAMAFARTYALGLFHQRSGFNVAVPFTRFTHAPDHLSPASVPTNDSAPFLFTWMTVSNYARDVNLDNPPQVAPQLTNFSAQLYPFVSQGQVTVPGGHFEAGDYNRVTYNAALLIHSLVFAVDSLPGVAALDNLGLPESGDGISDLLQEAKWEADFLSKMQDADGGFYYSVYPQSREYEYDVLPENGDPEVVWPKNTACSAAAVAALAQCASSPHFKQAYPQAASNYWSKALFGWQFLTNAIARFGFDGSYQKIQHFGDDFTHRDELAWAACEMFLATGDPQFQQKLFEWFPDPTDPATFHWGEVRMYACFGNAVRDYAFASNSGRPGSGQLQQSYLAKCINVITNCGNDNLNWSRENAYGTSFPAFTKSYRGGGWYFSSAQAFDLVVAYQVNPDPAYLDAILRNLNYEAGCNPVNAMFVTGLGWKRQRNIVDQYSFNDRHVLPKDGVLIGNILKEFLYTWTYGTELSALAYPNDDAETRPYAYYDRWCDDWNVSTEGSSTDTTRSLAGAAWLAARTALAGQTWRWTNASLVVPATARQPNQPLTVTLNVADTNLSNAKIIWEAQDQEPEFGNLSFTFTPTHTGSFWVEAEVQWPDGRRAFAMNAAGVSTDAPPQLSAPQRLAAGGFSFLLAGAPQGTYVIQSSTNLVTWIVIATNTLPANGLLTISDLSPMPSHRFYRALK